MHASVADAFTAFTVPLEGRVRFMYLDSKQLVTTGIGNLLDADDPDAIGSRAYLQAYAYDLGWTFLAGGGNASHEQIDAEYDTVKASGTAELPIEEREAITRLRISEETIDTLVRDKLSSNEAYLQGRPALGKLADWPADAQLALFSMAWALGPGFDFPHFLDAVAVGDWRTAARESHMSERDNPGVRPRNVRNGLLFTLADWIAAPEPGDFSVLVYDPSLSLADNMRSGRFPVPLTLDIGIQTALELLSERLSEPAYDPNGLDGAFGRGTRNALTRFQRDQHLQQTPDAKGVDGVGAETVAALAALLDEQGIGRWPDR
ncbi:peptidoglycan-binding domain-containing protein [Streptomyces sp. NPDC001514]